MRYTYDQLQARYEEMTSKAVCLCDVSTPLVGGQSATEQALRDFIKYHLKIEDPKEAEATYQRIMKEEMGEREKDIGTGELAEKITYGINIIRRTNIGPYLGNWMIQACIKVAMSQLGMFVDMKGTKGKVSECGLVRPHGISKLDDRIDCVYLIEPQGNNGIPATTYYDEFKGKVTGPSGSKSIMHHSEAVPPGTMFEFEFRYIQGKLREQDMIDALALAMTVGLGSTRSLGNGKWRILEVSIDSATKPREKPEKEDKAKASTPKEQTKTATVK